MTDMLTKIMQGKIDALAKMYTDDVSGAVSITFAARNVYITKLSEILSNWIAVLNSDGIEEFRKKIKDVRDGLVYCYYDKTVFNDNHCMNEFRRSSDSIGSFGHHASLFQGNVFQQCEKSISLDINREMVRIICGLLYEISKGDAE